MDISTIIGMILGSVLIVLSILLADGSDLGGFWSTSSAIVVPR